MNKLILILILFCFSFISCTRFLYVEPYGKRSNIRLIPVNDTLFVGNQEVSTLIYRIYAYRIKKLYGDSSDVFKNTHPDYYIFYTEDFEYEQRAGTSVMAGNQDIYFGNYTKNPIVGISYEQALAYCSFYTDEFNYHNLMRKKALRKDLKREDFRVESYLAGKLSRKPGMKLKPVMIFRLPSIEEWELFGSGGYNLESHPYGIDTTAARANYHKKMSKDSKIFGMSIESLLFLFEPQKHHKNPEPIYFPQGVCNSFGICHTVGSVSEMTATEGIAKGGSWCHPLDSARVSLNHYYNGPAKWLGFRVVGTWYYPGR